MKCTIFSPIVGFSLYGKAYGNKVASDMLLKGQIQKNVEKTPYIEVGEKVIDSIVSNFMINDAGFTTATFTKGTEVVKRAMLDLESYGLKANLFENEGKNVFYISEIKNGKKLTKAQIYQHLIKKAVENKKFEDNSSESVEEFSIKKGVSELFESNPELASIGTAEQYSQYLDTIFPDSTFKDIVYHGTDKKFQVFDKLLSGLKTGWGGRFKGIHFFNNNDAATTYKKSRGDYEVFLPLYLYVKQYAKNGKSLTEEEFNNIISDKNTLVKVLEGAHYYGAVDIDSITYKEYKDWADIFDKDVNLINFNDKNIDELSKDDTNKYVNENGNVVQAMLNIKNPLTYNAQGKRYVQVVEKVYDSLNKSNDGIVIENTLDRLNDNIGFQDNVQVVFEPEQIHILGNKQDIEGFKEYVNTQESVEDELYLNSEFNNNVVYQFKAVDRIYKNLGKVSNWFKQIGNTDKFWIKLQQDLQIPKEQISLLKEIEGNTIEEKLASFAANYSYTVEINTAKENHADEGIDSTEHANLNVPGGTNYKINVFKTPLIIPSIISHFFHKNQIGWFRSDEQKESKQPKYYLQYGSETPTSSHIEYFNSKEEAQNKADEYNEDDEFGIFEVAEEKVFGASKTRRILEVQSDLFQKGRDSKYLIGNMEDTIEELGPYTPKSMTNSNSFLQLLNKDNNWVTFFIKSIIQDSAKKGYEKVLFPSGKTVEKIEGFNRITEEIEKFDKEIQWINSQTDEGVIIDKYPYTDKEDKTDKTGIEAVKDLRIQKINKDKQHYLNAQKDTLSTINFYENTVTNILKKQGYNPELITDEYGNTWNEITLDENDLQPIFFSTEEEGGLNSDNVSYDDLFGDTDFEEELPEVEEPLEVDVINLDTYKKLLQRKKQNANTAEKKLYYDRKIKEINLILQALQNTDNLTLDSVMKISEDMLSDFSNMLTSSNLTLENLTELDAYLSAIKVISESTKTDIPSKEYTALVGKIAVKEEELKRQRILKLKQELERQSSPANKQAAINELEEILKGNTLMDDSWLSANFHSAFNSISALIQSIVYNINQRKLTIEARRTKFLKELQQKTLLLGKNKKEAFEAMIQLDSEGNPNGFMLQEIAGDYFKKFGKGIRIFNKLFKNESSMEDLNMAIEDISSVGKFSMNEQEFDNVVAPALARLKRELYKSNLSKVKIKFMEEELSKNPTATQIELDTAYDAFLDSKIPEVIAKDKQNVLGFITSINNNRKLVTAKDVKNFKARLTLFNQIKQINKDVIKHKPKDNFYDKRYQDLMARPDNDPVKEYYLWYINTLKQYRAELGIVNDYYQPDNYIPELEKEVDLFKNGLSSVKSAFLESVSSAKSSESAFLLTSDNTPIFDIPFTALSGNLAANEKSYVLDQVLENFVNEVLHKVEMSKIQDQANIALEVIKHAKFQRIHQGKPVRIFGAGKNKPVQDSGNTSLSYKLFENFIKTQVYKQAQNDETFGKEFMTPDQKLRIKELQEKLDNGTISSAERVELIKLKERKRIKSYGKMANKLIRFTALKALGLSLFGGVFESINGIAANLIWASDNGDINKESLYKTFGYVLAMAKPNSEDNRYAQIIHGFNIKSSTDFSTIDTRLNKLEKAAFAPFTLGDKFNKCWTTLALLEKEGRLDKIEVINGQLYENGIPLTQEQINHVTIQVNEIHKNINSRSNELDPILANRTAIGRLLLQFRGSWIFEGFRKRFGDARTNYALNRTTKGYYTTLFQVIAKQSRTTSPDGESEISSALLIKNIFKFLIRQNFEGLSEIDKENLQRVHKEVMMIGTLTILYVALSAIEGDDDDEENNPWLAVLNPLQNTLYRLQRDSTFFLNPMSAQSVLSNIAPSVSTLVDFYKVMRDIWQLPYDPYYYEGTKREMYKLERDFPKAFPIINQPKKIFDMFTTDMDEKQSK